MKRRRITHSRLVSAFLSLAWLGAFWLTPAAAQVAERPTGLGPFEPLHQPRFVPAAKADFLKSEDQVLGVSANGVAKAYRTDALAWHHIIHDQLGNTPILATW